MCRVSDSVQGVSMAGLGSDAVSIPGTDSSLATGVRSLSISEDTFLGKDVERLNELTNAIRSLKPGCFLSSDWEVPYATDVNRMHEIMKAIRGE